MKTKIYFLFAFLMSSVFSFGQNYCFPNFFLADNPIINNFAFHTLVNSNSGHNASGNAFFPSSTFTTKVALGKTYPITITNEYPAGPSGKFAAWIDYNNDGIFGDDEIILYDDISEWTTSRQVTIPNINSCIGKRRLRVISGWQLPDDILTPCGNYGSGESEDYEINIVASMPDTISYCMPFPSMPDGVFIIDNFSIDNLVNSKSGYSSNGYTFYPRSQFSVNLVAGLSYPVNIYNGISAGVPGGFSIWVDLNDDGNFTDLERMFHAGPNLYTATGTLTIPDNASLVGLHRLRVRSEWGEIPIDPCGLSRGGETEDYVINVLRKPTSVTDFDRSSFEAKVFPNPSIGRVNIIATNIIDQVSITDLYGQLIYSSNPNQEQTSFELNNSGIYFVTVSSLGISKTSKLIVEK